MDAEATPLPGRWYTAPRFRRTALWLAALFIAGFGIDAVFFRDNDFEWHGSVGRTFLRADARTMREPHDAAATEELPCCR